MAKFTSKNIEFKDYQKAIFGTSDDAELYWDDARDELTVTTVISGVDPTDPGHLVTRRYLDAAGVTESGTHHHALVGLEDDDHLQYVPRDGSRGFTATVAGIYPQSYDDLTTKEYIEDLLGGFAPVASGEEYVSLTNFKFIQSLDESQTTSTSYVQKLRLTASGIPTGNYRIGWSFGWRQSKTNAEFWARVQVNDSEEIFTYEASPYVDVSFWNIVTNFYYKTLASGNHYFDLDYRTSDASCVSYIRNTKFEFWRIL